MGFGKTVCIVFGNGGGWNHCFLTPCDAQLEGGFPGILTARNSLQQLFSQKCCQFWAETSPLWDETEDWYCLWLPRCWLEGSSSFDCVCTIMCACFYSYCLPNRCAPCWAASPACWEGVYGLCRDCHLAPRSSELTETQKPVCGLQWVWGPGEFCIAVCIPFQIAQTLIKIP